MGNRAAPRCLWDEEQKCIIEGSFAVKEYKLKSVFKAEDLDYDASPLIRREIVPVENHGLHTHAVGRWSG